MLNVLEMQHSVESSEPCRYSKRLKHAKVFRGKMRKEAFINYFETTVPITEINNGGASLKLKDRQAGIVAGERERETKCVGDKTL